MFNKNITANNYQCIILYQENVLMALRIKTLLGNPYFTIRIRKYRV